MGLDFVGNVFNKSIFKDSPDDGQVKTSQGNQIISNDNFSALIEEGQSTYSIYGDYALGGWTDFQTITFTPRSGTNHQIIRIDFSMELKRGGAISVQARLNEATMGTPILAIDSTGAAAEDWTEYSDYALWDDTLFNDPQASYDFTIQIADNAAGIDGGWRNAKIKITYLDNTIETINSDKWGVWTEDYP